MRQLDPSALLSDLELDGTDLRHLNPSVRHSAALVIASEIGKRHADWMSSENTDDYDFSSSPVENLERLQQFALNDFVDEENAFHRKSWFSDCYFQLGMMQGRTGIDMSFEEALSSMAQAYWDQTLAHFVHFDADQSPSISAAF